MKKNVYYIFDERLLETTNKISNIHDRAFMVHSLISSYNLLAKCQLIVGESATEEDLLSFHCEDYISFLKKAQNSSDLEILANTRDAEVFNLGYDCPLFENIFSFVKLIAGSSLWAAKQLVPIIKNYTSAVDKYGRDSVYCIKPRSYLKFQFKHIVEEKDNIFELPPDSPINDVDPRTDEVLYSCLETTLHPVPQIINSSNVSSGSSNISADIQPIAINWFGGWHHAQRDGAEGFCYVNDIVIAILYLLKYFKRILYIDLDVHHGNGVENAFLFSPRVFVLSLHKYEAGFYPASGSLDDIGQGRGKFYTANVPLKNGITDDIYVQVFTKIAKKVLAKYKPECIVVQCGADSIAGDPLGGFNLTPEALGRCLLLLKNENLPMLLLGGGGYNLPNTARCWSYLTSVILDSPLSNDIPDNPYFHLFGPGFELSVTPTLIRNENSEEYLQRIVEKIFQNLDCLPDMM